MADFTIVIGNKNYSSWSLRPWLVLKQTGAAFDEVVVPLDMPDTAQNILRHSPSGRVPALKHNGITVWDSLAIAEYLHELFPDRGLWPTERAARAHARSISAEMHSGFSALRTHHPMRIRTIEAPRDLRPDVEQDLKRINTIWTDCRRTFGKTGGPFLFGGFTIADAMFAPVVTRLRSYSIGFTGPAGEYADALWDHPHLREWVAAAKAETYAAPIHEKWPPIAG
ncbi:MAG: glutathione S-transferase family protein [Deltaproteobacteria bacterium]|nr:glutathione S-transferase family protein [Deltaproteobacteria bacterium]